MDWRWADVAIVVATLLGPVLAVQAQKFLERRRQIKERQDAVFRTLMTTRASALSPLHVEALNSVPITFYGQRPDLIAINQAWKDYLNHLNMRGMTIEVWGPKRLDLLIDLMHSISVFLGYTFTKLELRNDVYSPEAHGKAEEDGLVIRQGVRDILEGKRNLPMDVKSFPFQDSNESKIGD